MVFPGDQGARRRRPVLNPSKTGPEKQRPRECRWPHAESRRYRRIGLVSGRFRIFPQQNPHLLIRFSLRISPRVDDFGSSLVTRAVHRTTVQKFGIWWQTRCYMKRRETGSVTDFHLGRIFDSLLKYVSDTDTPGIGSCANIPDVSRTTPPFRTLAWPTLNRLI